MLWIIIFAALLAAAAAMSYLTYREVFRAK